jgi:hypothetical protein
VEDGAAGQYNDYSGAEQATMAIASVMNFLAKRGALPDVPGATRALDGLYAAVRDDEKYRPERFQAALEGLRKSAVR